MSSVRPCPLYDGANYEVTQSVGHLMVNLMTQMRREVEQRMTAHGLTDAQWKPLLMLKTGLATTAIELARRMDMDAGAITRLVDRLEAKGLVERVRSESDRRVVHLRLTAAGEAATVEVPYVLAAVNNDFLKGFSDAEWKQLRKLLERMLANGLALQGDATEQQQQP
ncbi:MAG: MarR family winged helix-turn-helix transcriptional regulator [Rubrivivax sp.]